MNLTERPKLTFSPKFYDMMTSAEKRSIGGRDGVAVRVFEIQRCSRMIKRIEILFIAPTARSKNKLRTYDLSQFKRWIYAGLVTVE